MVVDFSHLKIHSQLTGGGKNSGAHRYLGICIKFGDFVVGDVDELTYVPSFLEALRRFLVVPVVAAKRTDASFLQAVNVLSSPRVDGRYIVGFGEVFDGYSIRAGRIENDVVILLRAHPGCFSSSVSLPEGRWFIGVVPFENLKDEVERNIDLLK